MDYNAVTMTQQGSYPGYKQIMQCYAPEQAPVINALATNFAVCDRWFASVPSQTQPNRAFVHAGTSDGHVNNGNLSIGCLFLDIPCIYNVLENQGKSWAVFCASTVVPSLTKYQFHPQLDQEALEPHFQKLEDFERYCAVPADAPDSQKLPLYSFIEPVLFDADPCENDYHPPTDIAKGEEFLHDVYNTLRNCAYKDDILFIVTFDEHGGCYDHVPPPSNAVSPSPNLPVRDVPFKFDRYGVRVPAIVISSYVQPGTVFRANEDFLDGSKGEKPYDHTSILATLRDWLTLDKDSAHPFLASERIKQAPTLDRVLSALQPNSWPSLDPPVRIGAQENRPLNDLQQGLMALQMMQASGNFKDISQARQVLKNTVSPEKP
jgi:phospholipase C